MAMNKRPIPSWSGRAVAMTILTALLVSPLSAHEKGSGTKPQSATEQTSDRASKPGWMLPVPGAGNMRMPYMDAARGRVLFVEKGCVSCHSINGVGGHDATALDAHTMDAKMNPFEFAAKMWRKAQAMLYAQEEVLGEQILFTGDELADIIAFVHDDKEQNKLTEDSIPPRIRKLMHHTHAEPGGGPSAHGEEIGHHHEGGHSGMMHSQ